MDANQSETQQDSPTQNVRLDYQGPLPKPPAEHLRLKTILFDVAIIFALTFVGGLCGAVVNAQTMKSAHDLLIIAMTNLIFGTAGFTLSGCRAPRGNRWPHLAWVAVGCWLTGLINVILFGFPWQMWLGGAFGVAMMMAIGGAISLLFGEKR